MNWLRKAWTNHSKEIHPLWLSLWIITLTVTLGAVRGCVQAGVIVQLTNRVAALERQITDNTNDQTNDNE